MATCALDYEFYSESAAERVRALSHSTVMAFIYSRNAYTAEKSEPYDGASREVRTVAVSGTVLVPTLFFTKHLGATLSVCRGKYTLKLKGKKISFKVGEREYATEGGEASFTVAPRLVGKYALVPAIETSEALGLCADVAYSGRLLVVGDGAAVREICEDEKLFEAAAYLVFGKYEPSSFKPEDYAAARANWRRKLVGSEEINDLTDDAVKAKIGAIESNCKSAWDSMNRGEGRVILWGSEAPVESNQLWNQYQKIVYMAKGWGTFGSAYYHNEELHADILDAMRWMYENMYGEAEIEGTGWRDVHLFNWWYWYIAAPEFITDVFLIMEDSFTMEEKKRYLRVFDFVGTFMCGTFTRQHALSRICICTKVAIVLHDEKRLYEEYVDFDVLLGLGELVEGPRVDFTQWTHGFPMNVGYGALNLDRVLYAASSLMGTALEYSSPKMYNLFDIVRYMYEPALYRGQAFMMFHGRSTAMPEYRAGAALFAYMLPMIGVFGEDEDEHVRRLIKRNVDREYLVDAIKSACGIEGCVQLKAILSDPSVSSENDYEYAHAYFTGDRAVQQRNNYAVGIAMNSKREPAYESINNENKQGWYSSDASMYLYTDYDRNSFDGDNFLAKNINIAYRFPGTVEDSQEMSVKSIRTPEAYRPSTSFAGSLQLENKYLTAAMDFEAHHFDGPYKNLVDAGYGGGLDVHHNDLVAKRAYFCFDDEIVVLGAGIKSTMNSPVHATVEHRRIVNDEKYSQKISADGRTVTLPKSETEYLAKNAEFALMEGHAGYVFLDGGNVYAKRYVWENAASQSFFELGIDFGENPDGASYAYAVIPYADEEKLARYAKTPDVKIVSNTAAVQAVREEGLGVSSIVFHESAECACEAFSVRCGTSAIVMTAVREGVLQILATDPTHELSEITLTISKALEPVELDNKVSVKRDGENTVIKINTELANGRPFGAKFKV